MLTLIVILLSGGFIAFFATQNTQPVSIFFVKYQLNSLPMYVVILASVFFGIFISWLISMVASVSSFLAIHSRDKTINEGKKETVDLTKTVHQLELENERLKTELNRPDDEKAL